MQHGFHMRLNQAIEFLKEWLHTYFIHPLNLDLCSRTVWGVTERSSRDLYRNQLTTSLTLTWPRQWRTNSCEASWNRTWTEHSHEISQGKYSNKNFRNAFDWQNNSLVQSSYLPRAKGGRKLYTANFVRIIIVRVIIIKMTIVQTIGRCVCNRPKPVIAKPALRAWMWGIFTQRISPVDCVCTNPGSCPGDNKVLFWRWTDPFQTQKLPITWSVIRRKLIGDSAWTTVQFV